MAKMNYRRAYYNDRMRRYGSIDIREEKQNSSPKPRKIPKCARLFCTACGDPFFAYPWRLNQILSGNIAKECSGCRETPFSKPNRGLSSSKAVTPPGTSGQRNKSILVSPPHPQSHGITKANLKQSTSNIKRSDKAPHCNSIKENLQKGQPETEPVLLRERAALLSRAS